MIRDPERDLHGCVLAYDVALAVKRLAGAAGAGDTVFQVFVYRRGTT
jgi:hypothetical protein